MKNRILAVDGFEISFQTRSFVNRTTQRSRQVEYKDFDITFTTGDEKQTVTTIRLNEDQASRLSDLIDKMIREG